MGQITNPIVLGISVLPTDRQSGLLAGGGATGNDAIFLGQLAGQNSTISNFIAIGHHAADGGITDAANLNGTTVLGANSLGALTTGAANALPLTVIGSAVANSLVNGDSSVLIGSKILSLYAGTGGTAALANSVIIGNNLMPTATGIAAAVSNVIMIGNNIFPNVTGFGAPAASIFIGNNILQGIGNNVGTTNSIYIGQTSGSGITGATAGNICIGVTTTPNAQGGGNIIIGTAAQQLVGTNTTDGFNIIIGNGATSTGAFNVVLGAGAKSSANLVGVGNVIIGSNAGLTLAATTTNLLVIESATATSGAGSTPSGMLYGSFLTGNLIIGNSTVAGNNRDFGGTTSTNILKLLNGTVGNANPVGGGYLYVSGGILFWIDSSGTQSQLSESVQGQLASSALNAFSNNAAAAAGTLLNAPVAGNPTKWIPINDNGTIRNIPAW